MKGAHTKEEDEEKVSTTMDDGEVFGEMDGGVCEVVMERVKIQHNRNDGKKRFL